MTDFLPFECAERCRAQTEIPLHDLHRQGRVLTRAKRKKKRGKLEVEKKLWKKYSRTKREELPLHHWEASMCSLHYFNFQRWERNRPAAPPPKGCGSSPLHNPSKEYNTSSRNSLSPLCLPARTRDQRESPPGDTRLLAQKRHLCLNSTIAASLVRTLHYFASCA